MFATKIKNLLILFAVAAVLTAATGGYFFYHSLIVTASEESRKGWDYRIIVLCMIFGVATIALYRKANVEIKRGGRMEDELRSTSERLQALIKASPLPIVIMDQSGITTLWNPAAEQVFGWTKTEVLGKTLPMIPGDREDEFNDFRKMVFGGHAFRSVETKRLRKDGGQLDVELSTAPLRDPDGTIASAMAIYEDISERKKKDEELRFLAAIIQNLPEAMCAIDHAGNTVAWNDSAEKLLGYAAGEIIGKPIATVIPPEIAQMEFDHCLNILKTEGFFSGYESIRLSKDGRYIPVEITAVAIKDGKGAIQNFASIMVDITERKKADEERMKVHTLESIGILAGGIAHDFNNLLCSIMGNIEVAKFSLPPEDRAYEQLTDAEAGCEKAQELSDRLITFATGGEPLRKKTALNTLINSAVGQIMKDSAITVEYDIQAGIFPVAVDERQMMQVFQNLALNAREAMPDGGSLAITVQNARSGDRVEPLLIQGKDYLEIIFKDTGVGIPVENLTNIFDPYFSTKNTYSKKGLGLGLAVCYSIIARHEGFITVESQSGQGTAFHVYLPAVA